MVQKIKEQNISSAISGDMFNNGSEKGEQIETIGYAEASDRKEIVECILNAFQKGFKESKFMEYKKYTSFYAIIGKTA